MTHDLFNTYIKSPSYSNPFSTSAVKGLRTVSLTNATAEELKQHCFQTKDDKFHGFAWYNTEEAMKEYRNKLLKEYGKEYTLVIKEEKQ